MNQVIKDKESIYRPRITFLQSLSVVPSRKNLEKIIQGIDLNYDEGSYFDYVDSQEGILSDVIVDINAGSHILLIGPKAAGKNTMIENLGRLYTRKIREIQCNAYTDLDTLLGVHTFRKVDGGKEPEVVFMPSEFIIAMEQGDFIVLDEINTVNPGVLSVLNAALDKRKRISVPGYGHIKAHENFRVFATMNEAYQGVIEMNEATLSRFSKHYLKLTNDIKAILKTNVPRAHNQDIEVCQKLYKLMLEGVLKHTYDQDIINIRAFVTALDRTLWDIPIRRALMSVVNAISDQDERLAVKQLLDFI